MAASIFFSYHSLPLDTSYFRTWKLSTLPFAVEDSYHAVAETLINFRALNLSAETVCFFSLFMPIIYYLFLVMNY